MPATAASSSRSPATFSPKKHDVFINFRGEDTRYNFTSHLYSALLRNQVETYIDYELEKGDEVWPELVKAIEDSHISILVFSENYASSTWCLKELTKILDCKRDQGQFVIPVFYNVEPPVVRKQTGNYETAFAKHEHRADNEVKKWKDALTEASNLSGWDSSVIRDESKLIQGIVNDILDKLHKRYPHPEKKFVGTDEHIKCIESLLEKAPVVVIWGTGGIGKTTIARTLFDKISSRYEGHCFLGNVREESKRHGLKYLRDKLLSELLKEENIFRVQEPTFSLQRLSRKKVLIVLDDVSSVMQLDDLVEKLNCMMPDSRIIITTRYKKVLNKRVHEHEVYEVKKLDFQSSLLLFSLNAFNKTHPNKGFEELSRRVVDYVDGIPLALKVLGRYFGSQNEKEVWENMLGELEKQSDKEIQGVLRLSYDGLEDMHKEIFLDIACFFKGEFKKCVIVILEVFGFYALSGIQILEDHALISISDDQIQMHDLIQKMGWNIVREESKRYPGRRSRLFNAKDIHDVLKYNKGTDAIEGIYLDMSSLNKDLYLRPDVFNEMINLRYLKIYSSWVMGNCNLHFTSGLESISDKLGYLKWHQCSLKSLPSTFSADQLCLLHMPFSHVEKLWNGVQDLVNLKEIVLSSSRNLIELPDFSKASNLEYVDLTSCIELKSVREFSMTSIGLSKLRSLIVSNCLKLTSIPELPPSVTYIVADNCMSLETVFPSKGYKACMSFENCMKLEQDSLDGSITLKTDKGVRVNYPGSKVPEWFNRYCNRTKPASDLVGFIFCVVSCFRNLSQEVRFADYTYISCECHFDDDETPVCDDLILVMDGKHSDCVCIWYDPDFCKSILAEVERRRAHNQCATYNPKLSFEFVPVDPGISIKEWAICPIYESDSDVEIMLRMGTKRRQDIDELEMDLTRIGIGVASSDDQQPLPPCKKLKLSIVPPVPQELELMLGSQTKKSGDDIDKLEALCKRMKIS